MAGNTPEEAVRNFVAPIERAIGSFVGEAEVTADSFDPGIEGRLELSPTPCPFELHHARAPVLAVGFSQRYRIVEDDDPDRGPWKVHITAWYYTLFEAQTQIIGFHWHPDGSSRFTTPHAHVYMTERLTNRHVPTGRVLIEDVLELAVELGAEPTDTAWSEQLEENRTRFLRGATWGHFPNA